MFCEIQIRIARLLTLLAAEVARQPIDFGDTGIPAGSVPGIPAEDGPLVVDHIEFPDFDPADIPGGVIRTVPGPARFLRYGSYSKGLTGDVTLVGDGESTKVLLGLPVRVWVVPRGGPAVPTALPLGLIWLSLLSSAGEGTSPAVRFVVADVSDVAGILDKDPDTKAAILARLTVLKAPPITINLAPLKAMGLSLSILYADIGITNDREALALRMEIPTEGSVNVSAGPDYGARQLAKWLDFYAGKTDGLPSAEIDWSYSVEAGILERYLPDMVRMGLHPKKGSGMAWTDFDWSRYKDGIAYVTGGPTVTFSEKATLVIRLGVDLKPCSGLLGENVWPHVELTVVNTFSTGPRGTTPSTQLIGTMDVFRDTSNIWECEIAAGLFFGLSEAAMMAAGGFVGLAIGLAWGFFTGFYAVADIAASTSSGLSDKNCKQTKWPSITSPGEEYECVYALGTDIYDPRDLLPGGIIRPGATPIAHLGLTDVLARTGCFSLGGTFDISAGPVSPAALVLELQSDAFVPLVYDLCGTSPTPVDVSAAYRARVAIRNATAEPRLPLYLFDVEVPPETDPAGQYAPYLHILNVSSGPDWRPDAEVPHKFPTDGNGKVIEIRVPLTDINPDFEKAPYDCVISVRSSGGVQQVRIPALKPLSDEEKAAWPDKIKLMQAADCGPMVVPLWDIGSLRDLWSNGGDPPSGTPAVQIWEFGVIGLNPGDTLTLTHDALGVQSTGIASRTGAAFASALVPAEQQGGMTLARMAGGGQPQNAAPANAQTRGIALRKSLLLLRSGIQLDAACNSLAPASGSRGEPLLLCVSPAGLGLFDIGTPAAPARIL